MLETAYVPTMLRDNKNITKALLSIATKSTSLCTVFCCAGGINVITIQCIHDVHCEGRRVIAREAIENASSLIDNLVIQSALFLLRQLCCWTLASEFCSTVLNYIGLWDSLGHRCYGYTRRTHHCFGIFLTCFFFCITFRSGGATGRHINAILKKLENPSCLHPELTVSPASCLLAHIYLEMSSELRQLSHQSKTPDSWLAPLNDFSYGYLTLCTYGVVSADCNLKRK